MSMRRWFRDLESGEYVFLTDGELAASGLPFLEPVDEISVPEHVAEAELAYLGLAQVPAFMQPDGTGPDIIHDMCMLLGIAQWETSEMRGDLSLALACDGRYSRSEWREAAKVAVRIGRRHQEAHVRLCEARRVLGINPMDGNPVQFLLFI